MQLRRTRRTLISLVAVAIFMFSMAYAGDSAAIPTVVTSTNGKSYSNPLPAQSGPTEGTWVNWNQETNSISDEWTWESRNWLFGPSPSFEIYHENGTLLTFDSFAEINEILHFVVTVPKSIFQGADLGSVRFYGWYRSSNPDFSAGFDFSYENFEYTYNPWWAYSHQYNYTEEGGPPLPSFMDILPLQCSNSSDSNSYYIDFAVRFTANAPLGLYELHMNVEDTDHNYIGSYNFGSNYEFQGIAVGMPIDEAWDYSYGGTYTLQKLDMDGDTLYSVSRLQDFIMRFNVSGDEPAFARLGFDIPGGMQVPVTMTGWHMELQTTYGGWVFDTLLGTYVWNASVPVTTMVEVYGEFETYQWTELGIYDDVNVTVLREEWNEGSQTWDLFLEEETHWVEKQMYYVYNTSTDSFDEFFGYTTWAYPFETIQPDTWNEEVIITEPLPPDFPIFYELNYSASSASKIGKEWVYSFVGHFTEIMPKTDQSSYFSFRTDVMGSDNYYYYPDTYGERPRQTQQEFNMAQRITIESPVTIARLLNADGTEPNGWMFQVDKEEPFKVRGRLQGGASIASDIDGVEFRMQAHDGFWSETENRRSDLEIIVQLDMTGNPVYKAYNRTEKNNWTFGIYMDYVLTEYNGWHYEYNATTNMWDWVYGTYKEWTWTEVEGWHWEWWNYNQATGKWQKEWIPYRGYETLVSTSLGTASGFTKWVNDGDLYVSFMMTMSSSVPDTNYWWEFAFMNNTWYEDYDSYYGEHEVESWANEWVYSFDYMGERVYVDKIEESQLSYEFLNGTLAGQRALGVERPFIVIDGERHPIKVRENYDPWSGETWTTMFLYDHYDSISGKDIYKYELTNGTPVFVTYEKIAYIYNVTTATGISFLTAQEYEYFYYDGLMSWFYWVDLDGVIYFGTYDLFGRNNLESFEIYDKVVMPSYPEEAWFILYGSSARVVNLLNYWWESRDQAYYLTTDVGTLLKMRYNEKTYNYEVLVGGIWEVCSYPERYFIQDYMGSPSILSTYNLKNFWYTEHDGLKHEMPYPNAHAQWFYELDTTESQGGTVPVTSVLIWNGIGYPIRQGPGYPFIRIGAQIMEVLETYEPYILANGTASWDFTQAGFSGMAGTYDTSLEFTEVVKVNYNTTDNGVYPYWDGSKYTMNLLNGTKWVLNESYLFLVYEYDLGGPTFFSTQDWPWYQELGNDSWYEFNAIDGSIYRFEEWYRPPILNTYLETAFYSNSDSQWYFNFFGSDYIYDFWGHSIYAFWIANANYPGDLYLFWERSSESAQPIIKFDHKGTEVQAFRYQEMVYRMRLRWGYDLVYGLKPIESTVYKNYYDFVVGVPQWGMWGVKNWDVNPDNGALDLDGNFDTTDDQYFVQEQYNSKDSWTHDYSRMWIDLIWDPNVTQNGDDMHINSWMGLDTFTWSYEWNQTFLWYHADDFSTLSGAEMQNVKDQIISPSGEPMPGYWDISFMARGAVDGGSIVYTWEDILNEAAANGWDWMMSNEQSWTWMSFGISQNYGTSYEEAGVDHWLSVGMHYEYSGLMIWEDENDDGLMNVDLLNPGSAELSHYLIPDSVESVSFVTPGEAYGDLRDDGNIEVGLEDEVTWGVTFSEVNGTVFPFTLYGYWGWYDGAMTGSDLRTFEERPTKISIDELSFLVHFQGHIDPDPEALNNYAEIKVDNYIGNWDVGIIGGRDNLENRSLALNYFADVSLSDFSFKAGGEFADQESTVSADTFAFETAGAQFAEMIMGGVTYDWSKNTTAPYDVVSYTTPVGTFRQAFESENGQSATGWSSSSTMFYVTIGFPEWEGYSVYQDPVFVGYTSSRGTAAPIGDVSFGAYSMFPTVPSGSDTVTINLDINSLMPIEEVYLEYSTDMASWAEDNPMYNTGGSQYTGEIPPFPDNTQVYWRVQVRTSMGWTQSDVYSYIVGQGAVTNPTGPTTGPTGPGGGAISNEIIIMAAGIGLVAIIVLVLLVRRRR